VDKPARKPSNKVAATAAAAAAARAAATAAAASAAEAARVAQAAAAAAAAAVAEGHDVGDTIAAAEAEPPTASSPKASLKIKPRSSRVMATAGMADADAVWRESVRARVSRSVQVQLDSESLSEPAIGTAFTAAPLAQTKAAAKRAGAKKAVAAAPTLESQVTAADEEPESTETPGAQTGTGKAALPGLWGLMAQLKAPARKGKRVAQV
jgi:hypothetical protein